MTNYAVLGLGLMGEAIVFDILKFDQNASVFGYEIREQRREELETKFSEFGSRFTTHFLDLSKNEDLLIQSLVENKVKLVFGAIDYRFNLQLSRICIDNGIHFLDLGGNPEVVNSQKLLDLEAKKCNVTVIPDLGLAPGMANIIAAHGMSKFDSLDECHIRVGGLPQHPETILRYQQVFSIRGLTNEYLEDAIVIREGRKMVVPSLTEVEELEFPEPYGKLEAFQTAGGTSSLPVLFDGKIRELTYKTIRYPGHCQFFKFLKDFELLSSEAYPMNNTVNPREIVEYCLEKNLPKDEPDVVLVRITIRGKIGGGMKKHTYQLIDVKREGYSAMARTTAFPIAIVGQMIMDGIINQRGVLAGEIVVPENEFRELLIKRNIIFSFNDV